jgi:hypothetical protein
VGDMTTVNAAGPVITTGATAGNERLRGLLTFNLGELPPETLRIGAATLRIQQGPVRGTPFDRFGSLYTVSVPFGDVATPAFSAEPDTRTVCELIFFCHEEPRSYTLSSSAAPGPRSVTVTDKVSVDFNARAQRANRSQFRTYFNTTTSDGGTKLDGTQQEVDLGSGEASSGKPSLEVLYEYP